MSLYIKEGIEVSNGHTYLQWIFCFLASTNLFVHGLDSGWISPMAKYLKSESSPAGYPLTGSDIAWIASCTSLAAMFVVPIYGIVADRFGRKTGVIVIAALELISWTTRMLFCSFISLMISRIISGLAAGGCFSIIPMYIKEITQENLRGVLGTFPIVMQTTGILVMYIIGLYLDYSTVILVVTGIPIITILVMIKAPESPEFLVKQEKFDEAIQTVALLRGLDRNDPTVVSVVQTMKSQEDHFKSLPDITLINILKNKKWRRGLLFITITSTCYEFNGAFALITYASTILPSTGATFYIKPELQSLSFPVVMIIGSLTLASCVERFGRRPLLTTAFLITSISMFGIAALIVVQKEIDSINVPGFVTVIFMMFILIAYSGGVCPLIFIIMTEMFNFRIRAKIMGIVVSYGWFLTFFMLRIHTPLAKYFGVFAPFAFYGIVNLVGALFTTFGLVETKGRTEDEVLEALSRKKSLKLEKISRTSRL